MSEQVELVRKQLVGREPGAEAARGGVEDGQQEQESQDEWKGHERHDCSLPEERREPLGRQERRRLEVRGGVSLLCASLYGTDRDILRSSGLRVAVEVSLCGRR